MVEARHAMPQLYSKYQPESTLIYQSLNRAKLSSIRFFIWMTFDLGCHAVPKKNP